MNLFDIVGINRDDRGENMIVLTPSDHMLVPDFPGLPEDGCTITFERDVALSREDAQFITGSTRSSAMAGSDPLRRYRQQHHLPVEEQSLTCGHAAGGADHVVEAQAPKQLQLNRFLPPTPVRLLLDKTVRTRPVRWSLKASTVS